MFHVASRALLHLHQATIVVPVEQVTARTMKSARTGVPGQTPGPWADTRHPLDKHSVHERGYMGSRRPLGVGRVVQWPGPPSARRLDGGAASSTGAAHSELARTGDSAAARTPHNSRRKCRKLGAYTCA